MSIEVNIMGSCVCRDIFRHTSKGKYKVDKCISENPIYTIYKKPLPLSQEDVEQFTGSLFDKRMLKIQTSKRAIHLLKESSSKYLVMDLAGELVTHYIGEKSGRSIMAESSGNEKWYNDFYNSLRIRGKRVDCLDINFEELEEAYAKFARDIILTADNPQGYEENKIIMIESYFSKDIMGNDALIHAHDAQYRVEAFNEQLKKVYTIFYKYVQNCTVVKLPRFTHTSENHLRGVYPLHYTEETYHYFLKALDVICGYSQINTLENLYKEQTLKNQLETRVANSSMMYKLQERIIKLEKIVK